jgi:hypothetical protein
MNEAKINKQIKHHLFSAKTEEVLGALKQIKSIGNRFYIPLLFDLLLISPEKEIDDEVTKILGTVKDKETVNSFMRGIEDDKYKSIRKKIIVACWQNGLDFSTFLPVFIDLIIKEDWEIAFEAFTVIDNFEVLPGEPVISISIQKIEDSIDNASEQKQYFLNEILLKIRE